MTQYISQTLLATLIIGSPSLTAQTVSTMPPLSADVQVERITRLIDGNTLTKKHVGRFYRDNHQRSRFELGDQVVISDPVAKTIITLDTKNKKAKVVNVSNRPDKRQPRTDAGPDGPSRPPDLGTQMIEGYLTAGSEHVTVIPAGSPLGNAQPIRRVTRVWYSEALVLPLLTTIADPLSGNTTTRYHNLVVGQNPSVELFSVPDGFQTEYEVWQPQPGESPTIFKNPHFPQ